MESLTAEQQVLKCIQPRPLGCHIAQLEPNAVSSESLRWVANKLVHFATAPLISASLGIYRRHTMAML